MAGIGQSKIDMFKEVKWPLQIFMSVIKVIVSYFIIKYIDYGVYIVLAYLFYSLEAQSGLQFINTQEANHHFEKIYSQHKRLDDFITIEISEMKERIEEYEERISSIEEDNSEED